MRLSGLLFVFLVACSGGTPDSTQADAPANLPACTNVAYDPCSENAECESGDCHLFNGEFQICRVTCTPFDDSTCPVDENGVNGKCNQRGFCKPSVANACSRE